MMQRDYDKKNSDGDTKKVVAQNDDRNDSAENNDDAPSVPEPSANLEWYETAAAELKTSFGQDFPLGTIDLADVEKVLGDAPIKGSADANLVIVEYSDFECPFCQRHNAQKTLDTVVSSNDGFVAKSFGHYPLAFHAQAEPSANAIECIVEQTGEDTFFDYADKIFNLGTPSVDAIEGMLADSDVDIDAWKTCTNEKRYDAKIKAQMQNGLTYFGVRGTPGNVLIDRTTGDYIVISGAYPPQAFQTAIDAYKNA